MRFGHVLQEDRGGTACMAWDKDEDIRTNRLEYGEDYDKIRWITEEEAEQAEVRRKAILDSLEGNILWGSGHTKADCRNLSVGCRLCGEGLWSCLFVNGICNAHCFFCPTEQPSRSDPKTQGIAFPRARDYLDFVRRFGFKGVSLSGGEPLMTWDRSLHFASQIKNAFGDGIYLWLYTNGILADREKLSLLKKAGLNEIRINLRACGYSLEKVKLCVDLIPVVTVEIPAVPEDEAILKRLVEDLAAIGVSHLNLHQLRCTPHNRKYLDPRGYTYIHGPKVTILESELCALRVLRFVKENGIDLPVNYCSFVYKHRYQTSGLRRRCAAFVRRPYETITEGGMIRTLSVQGRPEDMRPVAQKLKTAGIPEDLWALAKNETRLYFHESLRKAVDLERYPLHLGYCAAELRPSLSYRNPFLEIGLNQRKSVCVERKTVLMDRELKGRETGMFETVYLERDSGRAGGETGPEGFSGLEYIQTGLQPYY